MSFPDLHFGLSPAGRVALAFALSLVGFLLVRAALFAWLGRLARRTATALDDFVLDAFRLPSLFWATALAVEAALSASEMPQELRGYFVKGVNAMVIFSMTLVVANISAGLLNARLRNVSESAAASGIARTLVRGAVVVLGGLMVLHQLGVAIAPVLTALGVGGLAVALALQDTLGNLFAGIHILLEKPFAIGHFVRLEGGDEGWVQDIGWRTTRLLTLSDHTVVIPNAKIAGSKIVNMHLPDPIVRVERKLLVAYESDPARVERVLQEELDRAVAELPQAVPEPRPDVLLEAFADSGLQYTVRFYVKEIALERVSCSLVLTRIAERLRQEGIEVPYPHRVVELRGGLPGPA